MERTQIKASGREKSTINSSPDNSMSWQHLSFSGRLQITFHQGFWEEAGTTRPTHTSSGVSHTLTSGALDRRAGLCLLPRQTHTHTHTGLFKHTSSFHMTKTMKLYHQNLFVPCVSDLESDDSHCDL